MKKHTLNAQPRTLIGRKVRRLRSEGVLPGTIYGAKIESINVQVSRDELVSTYKAIGETGLLELVLDSKKHPVLISNVQIHPVTGEPLHIDFREVDLTEKVKAAVPVELVGESPAEKQGMGTAVLLVNELEVEALPGDLPEKFEIDATLLTEVDQVVTVAELSYNREAVEIQAEADQVLAKVEPPQKEEVIEEPVAAEGETTDAAAATGADSASEASDEKKEE